MPTLILPPRFTPDSIAIAKAATMAGWNVERLAGWRVPDNIVDEVVLYGEPLFAAVVADSLGISLLEPPFDWLATLPAQYRGRDIRFTDLADARTLDQPAFIKPADDKCFAAKVYSSGKELPSQDVVDGATPVLVADPVDWTVEFRCFVLNHRIETLSPYLRNGELAKDDAGEWVTTDVELSEATLFAEHALACPDIALPPAVVVDVGRIAQHGWAIVEANAAWGSGIYGCEPNKVLPVIQRACRPKDGVEAIDTKWIVDRSKQ